MKIMKVQHRLVEVPLYRETEMKIYSEPICIKTRTIYLEPREKDGKTIFAAYDRETDTLYIQEIMQ